jgi:hypothetical protein
MKSYAEAKYRIPSQKEKMINLLREAGENGVTNKEFQNICIRWTARISELYKDGYEIDMQQVNGGIYKYVLKKEPGMKKSYDRAVDELIGEIDEKYNGSITGEDLEQLLKSKKFNVVRQSGSYVSGRGMVSNEVI